MNKTFLSHPQVNRAEVLCTMVFGDLAKTNHQSPVMVATLLTAFVCFLALLPFHFFNSLLLLLEFTFPKKLPISKASS